MSGEEKTSSVDVWKTYSENEVTHSAAHHMRAVFELHKQRGYARVTDVAKALGITTGSASTNLKSLKQKGFVLEDDNKFLSLSEDGARLTNAIITRRAVLVDFFINILCVDPGQAEIDACKTEHLFSLETTKRMEEFAEKWRNK